ncbi:MAG: hypothetical protein WC936_06200 [Candidatus Nanoarchaeia archaeon]|jgi:hypothetical protein
MVTYSIKSSSDIVSDEPHLRIYLMKLGGKLYIMGEDASGGKWYIANFTRDGSLRLIGDICRSCGLNLDSDDCIKTTKIDEE